MIRCKRCPAVVPDGRRITTEGLCEGCEPMRYSAKLDKRVPTGQQHNILPSREVRRRIREELVNALGEVPEDELARLTEAAYTEYAARIS